MYTSAPITPLLKLTKSRPPHIGAYDSTAATRQAATPEVARSILPPVVAIGHVAAVSDIGRARPYPQHFVDRSRNQRAVGAGLRGCGSRLRHVGVLCVTNR